MKKKAVLSIVVACVALMLCAALVGCNGANNTTQSSSSRQALLKFVEVNQSAVDSMKENYSALYSDLGLRAEGDNVLIYFYIFKDQMDPEAAAQALAANSGSLDAAKDTLLGGLRDTGVKDPIVKYQYYNSDGKTLIWEYVIE